eukprot:CAMPEP_0185168498 /NCGR_PEP_ID=MMETSP1139-20130426/15917_1 /TAXON_ID=298111 /ORGANISM="Pavlova sp., Strain CCMP459" /LENGTH=127 /DNA_ID=CAMNT_0027734011 /DNA_START=627 /DNA_END=1008 /DNA_ORIENTATION=+
MPCVWCSRHARTPPDPLADGTFVRNTREQADDKRHPTPVDPRGHAAEPEPSRRGGAAAASLGVDSRRACSSRGGELLCALEAVVLRLLPLGLKSGTHLGTYLVHGAGGAGGGGKLGGGDGGGEGGGG